MITTVTPNPSLDRTLHLPRFVAGHINRATATMLEPSGKGVNVALALHGVGVPACIGGATHVPRQVANLGAWGPSQMHGFAALQDGTGPFPAPRFPGNPTYAKGRT